MLYWFALPVLKYFLSQRPIFRISALIDDDEEDHMAVMGLGVVMDANPPCFYSWARESCIGLWDLRSLPLLTRLRDWRVKRMCSYVLKQTRAGGGGEHIYMYIHMYVCVCVCVGEQVCCCLSAAYVKNVPFHEHDDLTGTSERASFCRSWTLSWG